MPMFRTAVLSLCLVPAVAAHAADSKAAGKWVFDGDVQGYPIHDVCVLIGTDAKLTGSCTMEDKVRDTTGTFDGAKLVLSHPGEYQGDALTLIYVGKLQADGTVTGIIDVQPMGYSGTFTASRPK